MQRLNAVVFPTSPRGHSLNSRRALSGLQDRSQNTGNIPMKNMSTKKKKSKFKVKKDRVFKKHGALGEGRKLKKQKVPSLFDLAARQLPHTSQWSEGSDLHLKRLVTIPQQKDLKKIMGSELTNSATFARSNRQLWDRMGDIEPLSKREIDILMDEAFRPEERHEASQLWPSSHEVYSTLRNLHEMPDQVETLKYLLNTDVAELRRRGPWPADLFHSYADKRRDARETYMRRLRENLQAVKDDIHAVKTEVESEGRPFDFERDFTFEDKHGNVLIGSAAARDERQFLDQMALENYRHSLAVAESYRNDLFNYAHALVRMGIDDAEWIWTVEDGAFGENIIYHGGVAHPNPPNELYHRYDRVGWG